MDNDFKIFGDKNFSDLSQEIYENSKLKKTQIDLLIQEVHGYIQGIEDIAVVGPILKELLDVGVKNDDNLLKLATNVISTELLLSILFTFVISYSSILNLTLA